MAVAERFVDAKINQRKVLLFCKSYIPACNRIIKLLEPLNLNSQTYEIVFIDKRQDVVQIENYFQVLCLNDTREVPQLFICGKYFGGPEKIFYWNKMGKLAEKIHEAMRTEEEPTPTPAPELPTSELPTLELPKLVLPASKSSTQVPTLELPVVGVSALQLPPPELPTPQSSAGEFREQESSTLQLVIPEFSASESVSQLSIQNDDEVTTDG